LQLGSAAAPIIFRLGMFKSHPPIPEHLSDQLQAYTKRCFEPEPDNRPTAIQLLMDPFITQYVALI
jgi:mitogen-activated protein kinase kinase kinase 5